MYSNCITTTSSLRLLAVQLLQHNLAYKTNLPSLLGKCTFGTTLKQTHMRFHRMHEMTSTAMEATKPMDAERIMTTSMANETPSGYCFQLPHTGRQSEVFPTVLQEKPSWHWSVLQLTCPANPTDGGGWVVVSPSPLLPLPACDKRWTRIIRNCMCHIKIWENEQSITTECWCSTWKGCTFWQRWHSKCCEESVCCSPLSCTHICTDEYTLLKSGLVGCATAVTQPE